MVFLRSNRNLNKLNLNKLINKLAGDMLIRHQTHDNSLFPSSISLSSTYAAKDINQDKPRTALYLSYLLSYITPNPKNSLQKPEEFLYMHSQNASYTFIPVMYRIIKIYESID